MRAGDLQGALVPDPAESFRNVPSSGEQSPLDLVTLGKSDAWLSFIDRLAHTQCTTLPFKLPPGTCPSEVDDSEVAIKVGDRLWLRVYRLQPLSDAQVDLAVIQERMLVVQRYNDGPHTGGRSWRRRRIPVTDHQLPTES